MEATAIGNDAAVYEAMGPVDNGEFATHATPLIRNAWYVAARAAELTSTTPVSRRLLGTDIVLYRTQDGRPVALRNRCPHRSFPLAKGQLKGDRLVCGYHGMEFEPDGVCALVPALSTTPTTASVRSYPVVDRGPITWIWTGSPNLADESLIPDTAWLASAGWATVTGDFTIQCDYVAMHENLIDQTHFPFLHPGTVGTPEYARSRLTVTTADDQVIIRRELKNTAPPGVYGVPAKIMDKRVDRTSVARFVSPGMHHAHATVDVHDADPGKPEHYEFNITHLFTPETNTSIHYWWFVSRDQMLDESEVDDIMRTAHGKAYAEDVEALEWIMNVVRNDVDPHIELSFATDKPGLLARRIMHRLSAKEN